MLLLFPALGGLWDEGRHGKKRRNFGIFFNFRYPLPVFSNVPQTTKVERLRF